MIKELQRKYMLITMTSVTVVMLVILLAINIASYYKVRQFPISLWNTLSQTTAKSAHRRRVFLRISPICLTAE